MDYQQVEVVSFLERPNRFIAYCQKTDGEVITAHVKNTGRGREVFLPGAQVAVTYTPSPKRKTDYDLIAVKKKDAWFNIDSQLPNQLAAEGILNGKIQLPELMGEITFLKREVVYHHSKFDIYLETSTNQKIFVEVKGMTLENLAVGAFPDAPTTRGLKHILELVDAHKEGYLTYVLFIAQFEQLTVSTIHQEMQPEFALAIRAAQIEGVQVLTYNCLVNADSVRLKQRIPFDLDAPFKNPVNENN
ncbi:DNA/RNA nuclease SfsA [Enterococcus thailandicus]|uniref:DNA/RNA nuclease SfsA n=1 Tax=Enterococcus TaxID=1350 RepID=UPI001C4AB1E9|nr:DNA/RNA nuclease SfsA [Enterococcus thailandicus]MDT2845984.1 DNA/RNA nuclease SfsA [Enterococcus thailandicus]